MKRKLSLFLLLSAASLATIIVALPVRADAAEDVPPKKVRVGLAKSLFRDAPDTIVQIVMRPFKVFLEAQTGTNGEIVIVPDAETLGQQLQKDEVQIGVFQGYEFAWAKQKNPQLKALVLAVNENPTQRACLVVRKDSTAADFTDLKGQTLAYPSLNRPHCKLFLDNRCVKTGIAPAKYYSEVTSPADAEDALDSVIDGTAQCAVVELIALEAYKTNKPGRAKLVKALLTSEAFPAAVIAYNPTSVNPTVDAAALERFRQGLLGARKTADGKKLLQMCRITSFEEVPTDYEQVFTDIAKAYPPPPAK